MAQTAARLNPAGHGHAAVGRHLRALVDDSPVAVARARGHQRQDHRDVHVIHVRW